MFRVFPSGGFPLTCNDGVMPIGMVFNLAVQNSGMLVIANLDKKDLKHKSVLHAPSIPQI